MIVFQKIGDVSKESYKCIFKCDYYDEDINVFLNYINYYLDNFSNIPGEVIIPFIL